MEEYCSYSVSTMLKRLNFNTKCNRYYRFQNGSLRICDGNAINYNNFVGRKYITLVPTHKVAIAWIERYHKITISTKQDFSLKKCKFLYKYKVKGFAKREGYFLLCTQFFRSKEMAEHAALTQVLKDILREK